MAQIIQHKRGSLENLKNVNPVFRGEVLLATGSLNVHSSEFGTISQNIEVQFIGGLTDYFDGLIARKFNLKTRLGAILDPLSDKVFYLIPLTFLCKNNFIPFWSLSLILFRELIISSLRNSTKEGLQASML